MERISIRCTISIQIVDEEKKNEPISVSATVPTAAFVSIIISLT